MLSPPGSPGPPIPPPMTTDRQLVMVVTVFLARPLFLSGRLLLLCRLCRDCREDSDTVVRSPPDDSRLPRPEEELYWGGEGACFGEAEEAL